MIISKVIFSAHTISSIAHRLFGPIHAMKNLDGML